MDGINSKMVGLSLVLTLHACTILILVPIIPSGNQRWLGNRNFRCEFQDKEIGKSGASVT